MQRQASLCCFYTLFLLPILVQSDYSHAQNTQSTQSRLRPNSLKADPIYVPIDQSTIVRQPGKCIIGDQCGSNPFKAADFPMPCLANNTDAFILPDEVSWRKLQDTCPDIAKNKNREDTPVCCDKAQLDRTADGFAIAKSLFARCPSCWFNFRQASCQNVCNQDQSLFVYPEVYVEATEGFDVGSSEIGVPVYASYLSESLALSSGL